MRNRESPTILSAIVILIIFSIVAPPNLAAHDIEDWPVKGKLLGKWDNDDEKYKKAEDVSGIDCDTRNGFPRLCLVIDDEVHHAQFVKMENGRLIVGERIPLFDEGSEGKPHEFDGEGVAYADGSFYVIGSHGHPRDRKRKLDSARDAKEIAARIAATSHVIRVEIPQKGDRPVVTRSSKLRDIIAGQPELRRFMDRRLENNGLTIEGIAIRNDRIFVGFRAPHLDDGQAAVLSTRLSNLFNDGPEDTEIHLLRLGNGQGVRDLARYNEGFLVLAGPAGDFPGRFNVYWWPGKGSHIRFLKDLSRVVGDDPKRRPEAIMALDDNSSGLRALILFDGKDEGIPTPVEMPSP